MPEVGPIKDVRNTSEIELADLYQKLAEAEMEIESGKPLLDAEYVFDMLRKK